MITPFTDAANISRIYPSDVLLHSSEGGLAVDFVALTGQTRAIAKTRLIRQLGFLSRTTMNKIDEALEVTLDLKGLLTHRYPSNLKLAYPKNITLKAIVAGERLQAKPTNNFR